MNIGLIGQLRSGKTTVADYIRSKIDGIVHLRLAAPIYQEAHAIYNKYRYPWKKNRRLLEGLGEMFNSDPEGDFLLRTFMDEIRKQEVQQYTVICDDIRTLVQANMLKNHNFYIIKIVSSESVRKSRCIDGDFATGHYSDTDLIDYDADTTIVNNGSLDDLYNKIDDVIERLKGGSYGKI